MYHLNDFRIAEMTRLGADLRKRGADSTSMEAAATKVTRLLYDALVDDKGERACALVRLFKTHTVAELPAELKLAAGDASTEPSRPHLQCLTLLGTAGERPTWNQRVASKGHQVILLANESAVKGIPMIAALVQQLGLDIRSVVAPDHHLFLEQRPQLFDVFHVADAVGSPMVPSQDDFVVPFGIRSVIGFGGGLRNGAIFAVILFTKVAIDAHTAELFKTLSLNVKLALSTADEVFA